MKRTLMAIVVSASISALATADGGGMGGGMGGGGMMGGTGMLVVADDGSLLVTEMGMGRGMMSDGPQSLDRELIRIDADGEERWRVSFDDGWPMMPVTDGDLVVVSLADDWWMGAGGMGDGGWDHGGMMGGFKSLDDSADGHATLVALDLATGEEAWRLDLDGDMISMPQFAPDGSQMYMTVREMDGDHVGDGPMRQREAAGSGMLTSSTVIAVDRHGNMLWSFDLDTDGGMGGPMGPGGSS